MQRATLEEPAAVILHGGICEGGDVSGATVDLNAHEAGNGGQSQGTPKAHCVLLYSETVKEKKLDPLTRSAGISREKKNVDVVAVRRWASRFRLRRKPWMIFRSS